jgi:hypothetical protein
MSSETFRRAKPAIGGDMVLLIDRARRRRQRSSHPHLPHWRLRIRSHWRGGEMFFYGDTEKQRNCTAPAPVDVRNGVMVWVPGESGPGVKGALWTP